MPYLFFVNFPDMKVIPFTALLVLCNISFSSFSIDTKHPPNRVVKAVLLEKAKHLGTLPCPPGRFTFSPLAREAYDKALSLRFGEAQAALEQMKRTEPDNLMGVLVENYMDFLGLFLDDGAGNFKNMAKNMEPRLAKIAAQGDRSSPWFLYCQAEIRLQWAIIRSRNNDFLTSLSDIKQAYALLEENQRKFPDFIANKKSLGVMHTLAGNVPDEYKWAVRALGGMAGSTEQGMRELEEVLAYAKKQDFVFENETLVTYSFLQLFLNNQGDSAWKTIQRSKLNPKTNPMAAYVTATIGMRTSHNDEAIQCLQDCPNGPPYQTLNARQYLLGLAKLRRLDLDANQPLELFLKNFTGKEGVKEAYQKLAWYHWIHDNESGYRLYMNYVKLKGTAKSEGDAAAQREAERGLLPDQRLLRARLLFDGGYYQAAYDLLKHAAADYAADPFKKLEYLYRLGRISHKMGKITEATRLYNQAIAQGAGNPAYFACNAALQLGLLYEEKGNSKNAREAFNRCLTIKPEEYASSLHAQAKAGLSRLGQQ